MHEVQVDVDQVGLARCAFARAVGDDVVGPHFLCHGARRFVADARSRVCLSGHTDYLTIWDASISL